MNVNDIWAIDLVDMNSEQLSKSGYILNCVDVYSILFFNLMDYNRMDDRYCNLFCIVCNQSYLNNLSYI